MTPSSHQHDTDSAPTVPGVLPTQLTGLDPDTAAPDAALVDTVITSVIEATQPDPALHAWTAYAARSALSLYQPGHPRRRRALLADTAVTANLLPTDPVHADDTTEAIRRTLTLTQPADDVDVLAVLDTYLGLHMRGYCDTTHEALAEQPLPAEDPAGSAPLRTAILITRVALLSVCGRDDHAQKTLLEHAEALDAPGTAGRARFAGYVLDLADRLREHHQPFCNHHPFEFGHDRTRFSALLHGTDPAQHTPNPPPTLAAPEPDDPRSTTAMPVTSLDGLLHGLTAQTSHRDHQHQLLTAGPAWRDVWLCCDTPYTPVPRPETR